MEWRYVRSHENPADIGSRGTTRDLQVNETWMNGPSWLREPERWPEQMQIKPSEKSESESRMVKEVMKVTVPKEADFIDNLLERLQLTKTLRVLAWVKRFIDNLVRGKKVKGPLVTEEIQDQMRFLVKRAQTESETLETFKSDLSRLNLQKNDEGLYVCKGRIQGEYPVYLPAKHVLSEMVVKRAHLRTLHGGVGLIMSKVREEHWIPKLRALAKKVLSHCYGCKRFHTTPEPSSPQGNLPKERTEGETPFDVVGVDYAGPIYYQSKKDEKKSYILVYTCSLTRGLHLELLPDLSCEEFLASFKRFVAVRGRPRKIISDNGKTFHAASKWIKKATQDEKFHAFLQDHQIQWQFNLSKASWWGGMFERMVGLVKNSLYKVVGSAKLTNKELQEVLLDIQIALNNRPLTYCEDDVQLPVLTPNLLILGKQNYLLELPYEEIEDDNLRKRAKHLKKCKDSLWRRWRNEYMRALRERHDLRHNGKYVRLKEGDVVLIKGDEKNQGKWKIGVVSKLIPGRDGVVRAVRLRAGKSYLERPIQFLYPMELHCDMKKPDQGELNPEAREFKPKRRAAVEALRNIGRMLDSEKDNN